MERFTHPAERESASTDNSEDTDSESKKSQGNHRSIQQSTSIIIRFFKTASDTSEERKLLDISNPTNVLAAESSAHDEEAAATTAYSTTIQGANPGNSNNQYKIYITKL